MTSNTAIAEPEPAMIEQVAKRKTADGETIHNEPFEVRPDMVADAILAADAVGRRRLWGVDGCRRDRQD